MKDYNKTLKILCFIFLFILHNKIAFAEIVQSRPRIYLAGSNYSAMLKKACRDQNGNVVNGCIPSKQWTTFYNRAKLNINEWSGWQYALVYMMTKEVSYKTRAIDYVHTIIDNGMSQERGDSYLYNYASVQNASIIYDWLYDHLSTVEKNKIRNYINQNMDELWHPQSNPYNKWNGWAINNGGNNYLYHHMLGLVNAALALYGEEQTTITFNNISYTNYLDFFYAKMNQTIIPWLNGKGEGGGWHEGANYGQGSKLYFFNTLNILKESGGVDYFSILNFPKESVYFHLYTIQPGNTHHFPAGDLAHYAAMPVSAYDREVMLGLSKGLAGTAEGKYAQYWLNNVVTGMNYRQLYPIDFILSEPDLNARNYNILPLNYYAKGYGLATIRSSWDDNASAFTFLCSKGYFQSHQNWDQNSFTIWKNDWLAGDASTYSKSGLLQQTKFHNTFLVGGYGQENGVKINEITGGIDKYDSNSYFMYVKGNANNSYYAGASSTVKVANTFIRQFVAIPPYAIIFDKVAAVNSSDQTLYMLHVANEPTISGDKVIAVNSGKLIQKTLLPLDYTFSTDNLNPVSSSFRVNLFPANQQPENYFLNVYAAVENITSDIPEILKIDSDSKNMVGSIIMDSNENKIVMFPSDPESEPIKTDVSYSLNSSTKNRHLLFELQPDTKYLVEIDGTLIDFPNGITSNQNGTLMFEYTGIGEHSYNISGLGTAKPPAPTGFKVRRK